MAQGDDLCSFFQLISGDGTFNASGLEHFSQKMKLSEHGLSYKVVAIIGPQNTGKSTLLNHLFGTKFKEMDAAVGRSQTTRGMWLAKATNIDPCTLIIDIEGIDSSERAEDVTFEKQSALFALAMSDVLLINLWCHDIGREQAGCRTLLKTVFQVMMRLFTPRRRTLLFVIRDKSPVTPFEYLEKQLKESIQKIYDSVGEPQAHKEAKLSNFFDVHITSLPNFELQKKAFEEEVVSLRQHFVHSTTPGGLAGDQQDRVPASEISFNARTIWETIKKNKDLDLPVLKILVSKVRCEETLNEKFADFVGSKDWRHLGDALQSGPVLDFGKKMTSAIYACLSKYDEEVLYFDESVQSEKRQILQGKLIQLVQPAYQSMLAHLHAAALHGFQGTLANSLGNGEPFAAAAQHWFDCFLLKFDEGCKDAAIEKATWDSSSVRDKLKTDINAHIALVHAQVASSQATAAAQAAAYQAAVAADVVATTAANAQAAAAAQDRRRNRRRMVTIPLRIGAGVLLGLMGLDVDIFPE